MIIFPQTGWGVHCHADHFSSLKGAGLEIGAESWWLLHETLLYFSLLEVSSNLHTTINQEAKMLHRETGYIWTTNLMKYKRSLTIRSMFVEY